MIGEKLVKILRSFSNEEIKEFEKFLSSPYFNSSKSTLKFYKELVKFYPDFNSALLTPEYLYSRIFPGKPYHSHTMWNLSSGLEKLTEEYLVQCSLKLHPFERQKHILREMILKRLDWLYLKKLKEMEKMLNNELINDLYFLKMIDFYEFKAVYLQKVKGLENVSIETIDELAQLFTLDYLINISRKFEIIKSNRAVFKSKLEYNAAEDFLLNTNLEKIIETSKKRNYKYSGLIEFYCSMILCGLYPEIDKYYYYTRDFLLKNHKLFETSEKKNLAVNLVNHCLWKCRLGFSDYQKELFLLIKFRVKHDLIAYQNGKISKAFFRTAVSSAIGVNEIKWAKKFIEEFTPLLFEEYQEEMRNFANACVYYNTKKYDEVLESLNKFKYTDVSDKMQVKNLIAETYYDMKEFELLAYHIDSAKHFLKKNKNVGIYMREANFKFFNYLHSMAEAVENNDLNKLVKLEENIRNDNPVNNKIWLLEKLAEKILQ